ncbi:potassium channel family protein [Bacillus sp. A301a_S52]|nr:potassium channel family protein [Bacillus sp. A301a_S52]
MELLTHQSSASSSISYKIKFIYEIVMGILALISILFIWNESSLIRNLDFIIWLIFVFDVTVRFFTTKDKLGYIKKNPLDIVAIIPLDSIFRLARLARLIRLIRALAIMRHYFQPVAEILKTNSLDKVLVFLVAIIFVSSIPIQLLEPTINTYTDAIWWAIVTSTTVGYGDISPETVVGRLIAVVLMVFGIGLLGLVTSSVASYFLNKVNKEESSTVKYLKDQVEHIEELSDEEIERLKLLIDSYKERRT